MVGLFSSKLSKLPDPEILPFTFTFLLPGLDNETSFFFNRSPSTKLSQPPPVAQ